MHLGSNASITFTASSCYINKELLYRLAYTIYDPDGYEYDYTIFDLAKKN
jgi:hypothetical protein